MKICLLAALLWFNTPANGRSLFVGWFPSSFGIPHHDARQSRKEIKLWFRGGSDNPDPDVNSENTTAVEPPAELEVKEAQASSQKFTLTSPSRTPKKNCRDSSNMIINLQIRSAGGNGESSSLRDLISSRAKEYMEDLKEAILISDAKNNNYHNNDKHQPPKLPHPRKLLHFLAPKVPAIKQSPDVNLRIHSSQSNMDSGVAACIIATVAHTCEVYDKHKRGTSAAPEITADRRFEQLVECVLSGVNVQKRKGESLLRRLDAPSEGEAADIEEILDEENAEQDDGLSTRDACRAAWGIAILGCHHLDTLGGEKVLDLLLALSLRTRELLLARVHLLWRDDILDETAPDASVEKRLHELTEELAEDAASAMWTFACVRACTGVGSDPLFETCCSILCHNPIEMRRRAQEAGYDPGNPNIGSNDVIDQLAESEANIQHELDGSNQSESLDNEDKDEVDRDALLDWLSPSEVSDVLWALALHGSSNATTKEETTLSETASVLSELAFDRMIEWLEHDLSKAERINPSSESKAANMPPNAVVEVVDAATLLSSDGENISKLSTTGKATVESVALESNENVGVQNHVEHVEVVDAAALLASMEGNGPIDVETEVMTAPSTLVGRETEENMLTISETGESISESTVFVVETNVEENTGASQPIFSLNDLASIAWSVTELRDSLRNKVVGTIIDLIYRKGPYATSRMNGGELSNLAWSVGKYEASPAFQKGNFTSVPMTLISWIATTVSRRIFKKGKNGAIPQFSHALQPPEMGRLLWAIASTKCFYYRFWGVQFTDEASKKLARMALIEAASNLSIFATEDALRIAWAYLELCGIEDTSLDSRVAIALGRVIFTAEHSLHRWERGECQGQPQDIGLQARDASIFSSFFGLPRSGKMERLIRDHDKEDDDELANVLGKPARPLLRDLTIDPATLCKTSNALERLRLRHPTLKGGWSLTRVTLRILSSRYARLMRECSFEDLAQICEAAVLSDPDPHGHELIFGLFAHRVMQVVNDAIQEWNSNGSTSFAVSVSSSPADVCTLFWSLGELGAKHTVDEENSDSAYKKMKLINQKNLLTSEEIKSLDKVSAIKLFRGLILMKYKGKSFLRTLLEDLSEKLDGSIPTSELCRLAESLATLKENLHIFDASSESNSIEGKGGDGDDGLKCDRGTSGEKEDPKEPAIGMVEESPTESHNPSAKRDLLGICEDLLVAVATIAEERASDLTAEETRRLLAVYSLLPFQADELIGALDEMVRDRLEKLMELQESDEATEQSPSYTIKSVVSVETTSAFKNVKNGIKAFLKKSDEDTEGLDIERPSEVLEEMETSMTSLSNLRSRVDDLEQTLGMNVDKILETEREGSAFEIGRCQELIENYRRVEFSTGTRRSRYDKEGRRDIGKRVLSRLIP